MKDPPELLLKGLAENGGYLLLLNGFKSPTAWESRHPPFTTQKTLQKCF